MSLNLRVVLIIVFILAFAFQGSRGLYEPDEGRYTATAINMIRLDDWLVPHLNSKHEHLTKPPLTYWSIAISVFVLGQNEWAVRLPYALAFILTVICLFGMARKIVPRKPWLPPLIYATSVLPFAAANIVTTDTILTFWEALAGVCFVNAWWADDKSVRRRWMYGMWAAFGLAFLTKGPPGLLPLAGFISFILLTGDKGRLRFLFPPVGIVIFLITGFSWFLVLVARKPELLNYFLVDELFKRVATGSHDRHNEWYNVFSIYVPALLLGSLPWCIVLIRNGGKIWRRIKSFKFREEREKFQVLFLLTCWFLIPLAVFLISSSRMYLYVVPLFIPLSLAEGYALRNWTFNSFRIKGLFTWIILLVIFKGVAAFYPHDKNIKPFAEYVREITPFEPSRIIFLDAGADYGLSFYLDREVRKVFSGDKRLMPADYDSTALEEIQEDKHNVLWITKTDIVDPVMRILKNRGLKTEIIGKYNEYSILIESR